MRHQHSVWVSRSFFSVGLALWSRAACLNLKLSTQLDENAEWIQRTMCSKRKKNLTCNKTPHTLPSKNVFLFWKILKCLSLFGHNDWTWHTCASSRAPWLPFAVIWFFNERKILGEQHKILKRSQDTKRQKRRETRMCWAFFLFLYWSDSDRQPYFSFVIWSFIERIIDNWENNSKKRSHEKVAKAKKNDKKQKRKTKSKKEGQKRQSVGCYLSFS